MTMSTQEYAGIYLQIGPIFKIYMISKMDWPFFRLPLNTRPFATELKRRDDRVGTVSRPHSTNPSEDATTPLRPINGKFLFSLGDVADLAPGPATICFSLPASHGRDSVRRKDYSVMQ